MGAGEQSPNLEPESLAPKDSRVAGPPVDSRAAGPPADSRVKKHVDSRVIRRRDCRKSRRRLERDISYGI